MSTETPPVGSKPRYLWPWFLLAAVILGVLIAVISVRSEAERIKTQRSLESLPGADDHSP